MKEVPMDRLELLQSSGLIAQETCLKAKKVEIECIQRFGNSEKTEMFITHYALALERHQKGEIIPGLQKEAVAEIYSHPDLEACRQFLDELELLSGSDLSSIEEEFILIHLLNLINEKNNK